MPLPVEVSWYGAKREEHGGVGRRRLARWGLAYCTSDMRGRGI
jgi:hypothetical protein